MKRTGSGTSMTLSRCRPLLSRMKAVTSRSRKSTAPTSTAIDSAPTGMRRRMLVSWRDGVDDTLSGGDDDVDVLGTMSCSDDVVTSRHTAVTSDTQVLYKVHHFHKGNVTYR